MLWRNQEILYTLPDFRFPSIPYSLIHMSNFITEASGELEHVVWPTPTENKKYMIYTIGVIVIIGAFLAVLGFIVTNWLSLARAQFPHEIVTPTVSGEDSVSRKELDSILKDIKVNTNTSTSGAQVNTSSATGSGIQNISVTTGTGK